MYTKTSRTGCMLITINIAIQSKLAVMRHLLHKMRGTIIEPIASKSVKAHALRQGEIDLHKAPDQLFWEFTQLDLASTSETEEYRVHFEAIYRDLTELTNKYAAAEHIAHQLTSPLYPKGADFLSRRIPAFYQVEKEFHDKINAMYLSHNKFMPNITLAAPRRGDLDAPDLSRKAYVVKHNESLHSAPEISWISCDVGQELQHKKLGRIFKQLCNRATALEIILSPEAITDRHDKTPTGNP